MKAYLDARDSRFQSAPDRQVGGDDLGLQRSISIVRFQSAPDRQVGGDRGYARADKMGGLFQSAPDRQVGGDPRPGPGPWRPWHVSISPRPSGRGRLGSSRRLRPDPDGFNQPPTVRSGETSPLPTGSRSTNTFQSAPDRQVGGDKPHPLNLEVWNKFQSAPDRQVGGDAQAIAACRDKTCFNQPPTVRSGETWPKTYDRWVKEVSISPRPSGRGRHGRRGDWNGIVKGFNQPPTVRSGETKYRPRQLSEVVGFNQPPTVRSGETDPASAFAALADDVSISPRPSGRGRPSVRHTSFNMLACFNQPPTVRSGETSGGG